MDVKIRESTHPFELGLSNFILPFDAIPPNLLKTDGQPQLVGRGGRLSR